MIGLVTTARSFRHLAAYLERGTALSPDDRVAWTEARNLLARDIDGAAREMEDTAALSPRVEKPVYHLSVSFDPDDVVTKDTMVRVADRLLTDLGLADHQALVVAHRDAYYPHFHVMVNRVDGRTERAVHLAFPYYQIEKSLRHQERALGLIEAPGKHFRLDGQPFVPPQKQLHLPNERRRAVRSLLQNARNWNELEGGLRAMGLKIGVRRDALYVTDGTRSVRAGALQRGASLAKMERKFGLDWDGYREERGGYREERTSARPERGEDYANREAHAENERARPAMNHSEKGREGEGTWEATGRDASTGGGPGYAAVLEALEAFGRVERLEAERSELAQRLGRVERKLAERVARVRHLQALDREVDRLFRAAYADPGAARAAYDAEVHLYGMDAATRRLTDTPGRYGALQASSRWLPAGLQRGPREALQAAAYQGQELHHGLRAAGASLRAVRTIRLDDPTPEMGDPLSEAGRAPDESLRPVESPFHRSLRALYREPERAYRSFEGVARALGAEAASEAMRQDPRRFGALRTRPALTADQVAASGLRHASAPWEAGGAAAEPSALAAEIGRLQEAARTTRARIEAIGVELAAGPTKADLERTIREGWERLGPKEQKRLVEASKRLPQGPRLGALVQGLGVRAGLEVARESLGKEMTL